MLLDLSDMPILDPTPSMSFDTRGISGLQKREIPRVSNDTLGKLRRTQDKKAKRKKVWRILSRISEDAGKLIIMRFNRVETHNTSRPCA